MFEVFGQIGPLTLEEALWTMPPIAMLTKETEMLQPDAFCEHRPNGLCSGVASMEQIRGDY